MKIPRFSLFRGRSGRRRSRRCSSAHCLRAVGSGTALPKPWMAPSTAARAPKTIIFSPFVIVFHHFSNGFPPKRPFNEPRHVRGIPANAERVLRIEPGGSIELVGDPLPGRWKWYGGLSYVAYICLLGHLLYTEIE